MIKSPCKYVIANITKRKYQEVVGVLKDSNESIEINRRFNDNKDALKEWEITKGTFLDIGTRKVWQAINMA